MRAAFIAGALAVAVTAQSQYQNQSAPFTLHLTSDNSTIDGGSLSACHEGAAIEGFCFGAAGQGTPSVFNFNYSSAATPDPDLGTVGILSYLLHGSNFQVPSPMQLIYNPASNVAVPLLTPNDSPVQQVVFDADDKLAIPASTDDRLAPSPTPWNTALYYRWYVCDTYAGYAYTTLAWGLGDTVPQNPTCQKVDVVRKFA